jgi:hypothetical protein
VDLSAGHGVNDGGQISLADRPPTPRQTRSAIAAAAVLLLGLAVLAPIAHTEMPRVGAYLPVLDGIIFAIYFITAGLLLANFSITRSRALLALAWAYLYLYSAAILVAHGLTIGNSGSNHYNYRISMLWHLGSGLIDHSQNMTAAAMQIAEK